MATGPAHVAPGLTNPINHTLFPGYLAGNPTQNLSRRKGRREKPYRKFHIPCLSQKAAATTSSTAKIPYKDRIIEPKPYKPLVVSDWVQNPPGTGKAAKKAHRRARKRAARAQAKAEAEEEARLAREQEKVNEGKLAEEKKVRDKELYESIKKKNAERAAAEKSTVKTRSVTAKIKEERKALLKKQKTKQPQEQSNKVKETQVKDVAKEKGLKRKAVDDDDEEENTHKLPLPLHKKARDEEYVPSPDEDAYAEAVARAKAGKGKAVDPLTEENVDSGSQAKKRKRGDDDEHNDEHAARNLKKVKFTHDHEEDEDDDGDEDEADDLDSLFDGNIPSNYDAEAPADDPISTLPDLGSEKPNLGTFPAEVLERIVDACDPITRTLLGLANKRLGGLAITREAGFPCIRDRYGGDLERHRFMQLLEPWMNRAYTEAPTPTTIAEQDAREQLKERRLCYICRKYLPIRGKKCQYWKNCPKKEDMPVDPASQAARRAELERRRALIHSHPGGPAAGQAVHGWTIGRSPLPKVTKLKPKAQTFVWQDEDWSTLSVGLCKSRDRILDVKSICPKCTLTVHTIHLGWPPETPIVRWLNEGNPAGGRASTGHMPLSGEFGEEEIDNEVEIGQGA